MPKSRRPKKALIQFAIALVVSVVIAGIALFLGISIISNISGQANQAKQDLAAEKEKLAAEQERLKQEQSRLSQKVVSLSYEFVTPTVHLMPGQVITPSMIELQSTEVLPPSGTLKKISTAIGKVVKNPIGVGEFIDHNSLIDTGSYINVAKGMRAITIEVEPVSGLNGALTPGAHVDVLTTMLGKEGGITRTVLQNITIISVSSNAKGSNTSNGKIFITLSVTPQQAEMLTLAGLIGKFHLTLRNYDDLHKSAVSGSDLTTLMTGMKPSLSPNPSQPRRTAPRGNDTLPHPGHLPSSRGTDFQMQIFRGNGSETVGFKQ